MTEEEQQLVDKVVNIGRVTKVVKGGRIFKFTAIVIVGNMAGKVGIGKGKAKEIPDAIRKALDDAKSNIIEVPVVKDTIPHEVIGKFGSAELLMKPAAPGTGIISGGVTRTLFELAGINNILAKSFRSRTPINILNAAIDGFKQLRRLDEIAIIRGKTINDIIKISKEGA
ncbi:MAG: 30S ribosomal protein S5 [Deferribacterota bacterium]|nr:30S ribosomal protein S5 [Deferribacterota bacterium]